MWKWKVLHDFRIREEGVKVFASAAERAMKILGEIRVPEGLLFNFHCYSAIFNKKEEEC